MSKLIIALLIFCSVNSYGQELIKPYYGDNMLYRPLGNSIGLSFPDKNDSTCKKRGHVWKKLNTEVNSLKVTYPFISDVYIQDDKDTSFRVTKLIWNYSCERCYRDSASYKKEIIWTKP